jgi:phage baseplate assembly protein W
MAIRIPNKNPLDLTMRKAIGVSIPFNAPAVFNSTFSTTDQIKSNIINYILTNKGERVLNPNFGSNIRNLLFENITDNNLLELTQLISAEIASFFPMVNIQQFNITPNYDNNEVSVDIVYSIYNNPSDTISIIL